MKQSYEKYNCDFNETESSIITKFKDQNFEPIDVFKDCFSEDIMNYICRETVKYAVQGGDFQFTLSEDDLYKYFGILLLSGYNKLPQRKMYWETRTDSNNFLVRHAMNRNKFEKIHKHLHFNDNSKLNACDKLYKVRPLLDHLNDKFCLYVQPMGNHFSLDEAMEPYFGHHGIKQFIRGKPIRYGFKFWCLARSHGFLVKFYPYTGARDKIAGKTLGSSATEKLCLQFVPVGSCIHMDNYFTSLPLMNTLSNNGLFCVGTIGKDRTEKAPLQDISKAERGTCCAKMARQ